MRILEGLRLKQVFPVLILIMLCVGLLGFTIKIQPAKAAETLLSVSISPHYAVLSSGQSQLFNSTVTGGSPPYAYQWWVGINPVQGATNPTFDYTAPVSAGQYYTVWLLVTDNAGTQMGDWFLPSTSAWVWLPVWDAPVYFSVEPVPAAPLTNVNASINGLETPPAPSPIGESFTVEIHLRNATATNAPTGVQGVEVNFFFGNILDYCKPVGFITELGQPGGALAGSLVYLYEGFYDDNWSKVANPPYTNATQYIVAAASMTGPWNGNDGLVAKITFQITGQPLHNMSQPDFYAQLQIGYGEVVDSNANDIALSVVQGTLHIDGIDLSPTLPGDLNGDGKVSLLDLQLLAAAYNSHPADPNWNLAADLAAPFETISLTDLVTMAMHYGQHNP